KTHDPRGNLRSRKAFTVPQLPIEDPKDLAGVAILDWDGAHELRYDYDNWGNVLTESRFRPDGRPCSVNNKAAIVKTTYNRIGRELTVSYFDGNNQRILNAQGYWQLRGHYDGKGLLRRKTYHDTDGKLCTNSEGFAEVHIEKDRP